MSDTSDGRRQPEGQIRDNERFLEQVLDGIQDGISVLDRDLNILRTNRWMEEMYSHASPLEGKKCFAVYQQRDSACPFCPTLKAIETGTMQASEVPYANEAGKAGWIELSAFPLRDEQDEITGVIEYVKDISDRKRAEAEIQEAKSFAEQLIETANAIVVVLDAEGKIKVFNSAAERITGYAQDEIDGRNWFEVLVPRDRYPEVWGEFGRLLDGGIPQEFENPILTKSGEERHIVWKNNELIRNGEIVGTVSFGIDITERKQAEKTLRGSEERYRLAQRLSDVGTWEWNVSTGDVFWSDEVLTMFGLDLEAFGGKYNNVSGLVHPDDLDRWQEDVRACMEDGKEHNIEFRVVRPDGTVHWVAAYGDAERGQDGKAIRMMGVIMDITKRKQTEEALRESEEQLRMIVQTMPVMVDAFDEGQNLIVWNRECERVTGYSAEEIIGNPDAMQMLYPNPEYYEQVMATVRKMDGDFRNVEFTLTSKRGEPRTVLWSNLSATHPIAGWATWAVGVDVTERQEVVKQLRASTERLRLALQAASMGTWEWDVLANRVAWSPETLSIFGTTADEFGGTYEAYLGFAAPEVREEVADGVRKFLENSDESSVIEYDHQIVRGNGETGWVEVRGTLFLDNQGRPARMTGVCTDIVDRKQAEKEREELIAQLEAQNTELERFTYTVSHDLKSPLITIKGYIGLLFEDLLEMDANAVKSDLLRISRAADKMGDLLDDLLELSRIGRLANPPENVSLEGLAGEAVELLQGRLQGKRVRVDVSSDLPVVYGDRTRLLEVLQNLIDNAVKYMGDEPEPRIEIGSRQDDDETVCFVRDNGMGIDERFHDKVFGLFDQLEPTTEGTGIGLALVKRIIEVHGGRIWIESEGAGCGSTFCFTIPGKV